MLLTLGVGMLPPRVNNIACYMAEHLTIDQCYPVICVISGNGMGAEASK